MKLIEAKEKVFKITCTANTNQLKKERPDLTIGKDLRYRQQWIDIFEHITLLRNKGLEISLTDLEESEISLKKSLFGIGKMIGLSEDSLEIDWQRIKLESQFTDIHIEEL
jgi:hypothetical protein